MYEIEIRGVFSAAHQLRMLDGALEPLHGHNWAVRVTFVGPELNEMSVLADFTVVQPTLQRLLHSWHDRFLNELDDFAGKNPSAEVVATVVAERLAHAARGVRLACVEVEEAPGCVARFRPE